MASSFATKEDIYRCPRCRSDLQPQAAFCDRCGASLRAAPQRPTRLTPLSTATYGLALLCFFLPFLTLSCQNTKIVTLTGFQLVTGVTVKSEAGQTWSIPGQPPATLAFFAAAAGVFLSLAGALSPKATAFASMATGMLGAISLLSLKAHVDGTLCAKRAGFSAPSTI